MTTPTSYHVYYSVLIVLLSDGDQEVMKFMFNTDKSY